MEEQYNRRHGAKPKKFNVGNPVYALSFRNHSTSWKPGVIVRRRGRVLYEVQIDTQRWIRHSNQLRRRFQDKQTPTNSGGLTLNQLMDTDNKRDQNIQESKNFTASEIETGPKSKRQRRTVQPFQVNPRQKSYVQAR